MKRHIESELLHWYNSNSKKPLIIHGARQVGKTYSIRSFAQKKNLKLVEINFEKDLSFIELFDKTRNPQEILDFLRLSFLETPFNESTLLFLDEIQASPSAITALKFLSESFPSRIIASGSALGVAIASTSYPVGYVETRIMTPMTFIEFLWAMNIPEEIINTLHSALLKLEQLPLVIHEKFNDLFKTYILVGGMPEVVQSYVTNQSYKETYMIQKRLVNDYYNDMAKYAQGSERIKVRECYQSLPAQLAKDNKKFQYKLVKKGAGSRHYEASLQWLEDSHMIIKTFKLDNTQFPIEASVDQSSFKVYLSDTGMLVSLFGEEIIQSILMDNPTIKGVFYENSIIQLIKAYHKSAYYYEPNQYSEIDFIIKHEGQLCPIEVKSSHHTESRSFKHFVQKLKPKLSLRLSTKNIGYDADLNIYYLPHYLFEFFLISEKPLL